MSFEAAQEAVPIPEAPCPFCVIAQTFDPYDPTQPPPPSSPLLDPTQTSPATFVVLSVANLVAFLDIMPLSRGHLLLCPRGHRPKLTDATAGETVDMGRYLRILSSALARATGVHDWNIVQNNGAAAAQVVPHCHFHLIPRPELRASGRYSASFTMFGRGRREELDEDDAEELAGRIRECVAEVMAEDESPSAIKTKL